MLEDEVVCGVVNFEYCCLKGVDEVKLLYVFCIVDWRVNIIWYCDLVFLYFCFDDGSLIDDVVLIMVF